MHISIHQSKLKYKSLLWDTLYFAETSFDGGGGSLSSRIWIYCKKNNSDIYQPKAKACYFKIKYNDHSWVGTTVNSALGQINITNLSSTPPPWIQNPIEASALYIETLKTFTVNSKQGSNCRQKKPPKMNNSKYIA